MANSPTTPEQSVREQIWQMLDWYDCSSPKGVDSLAGQKTIDELSSLIDQISAERDVIDGCPCLLVKPCNRSCSCVNPILSGGCSRCAKYGSLEQRKAAAERLAALRQPTGEDK